MRDWKIWKIVYNVLAKKRLINYLSEEAGWWRFKLIISGTLCLTAEIIRQSSPYYLILLISNYYLFFKTGVGRGRFFSANTLFLIFHILFTCSCIFSNKLNTLTIFVLHSEIVMCHRVLRIEYANATQHLNKYRTARKKSFSPKLPGWNKES